MLRSLEGRLAFLSVLLQILALSPLARAQVIVLSDGPFVPYTQDKLAAKHGPDPSPFSRVYINVMAGPVAPVSTTDDGTKLSTNAKGYAYVSLDFVFSVASRLLMSDDDSSHVDTSSGDELKRVSAHVHVDALGADKTTVLATSRQDPSLLTVMLSPSDIAFGAPEPSSASPLVTSAVAGIELVPFGGAIGPLIGSFLRGHPQKPEPTFFSYQSADDEFGWTWYNGPTSTVEGTHRCAALLQAKAQAAYVRLSVELATDWNRFGVWTRTSTFLVPMTPSGAPPRR